MRLVGWRTVPPGLSQDEVLNADIVQGILHGRHALFFREGFGHEPLYHYFSAPFQALLGDNLIAIRLPSVVISMVLVAAVIVWARRSFGRVTAVIAGLGIAITWWPIIFGRIGLRPIACVLLITLTVLWWQRPVIAGILLGATMYTYTPALTLFGLPVVMGIHRVIITPSRRDTIYRVPTRFIVSLLVYAPLFLYLRQNPDLLQRGEQLSGIGAALLAGDARPFLDAARQTIGAFSVIGDPRWSYAVAGRPLLDPVAAVLFHIGLVIALTRVRQTQYALLLAWWGLGILPSMLTPDAPSTIRMVAAIPPTFVLIGLVFEWWFSHRRGAEERRGFVGKMGVLMGLLFLWGSLSATVRYGLMTWPNAAATRTEKYQPIWQDMADYIAAQPDHVPVVVDSGYAPIDDDSLVRSLGRDPAARWINAGNALIVPPGDALLYVPEFAPMQVDLFAAVNLDPAQPVYRSPHVPAFAVYHLPPQTIPAALDIDFGGLIMLREVRFLPRTADQPLALITVWQVTAALPADLSIFIHALPMPATPPATQSDTLDAIPDQLQAGDIVYQHHVLPLPADVAVPHILSIGLYRQATGERLRYHSADSYTITNRFYFDKAIGSFTD